MILFLMLKMEFLTNWEKLNSQNGKNGQVSDDNCSYILTKARP